MVTLNTKSCFTNLFVSHSKWTAALDAGLSNDTIYLDYSKAFDSVLHAFMSVTY